VDEHTPRASALHHGDASSLCVSQARPTVHASSALAFIFISSGALQRRSITGNLSQGFDRWWEQRPAFASIEKCLSAPAGRLFAAWFWFCPNGLKLRFACMHACRHVYTSVCWPHSTDMCREKQKSCSSVFLSNTRNPHLIYT
jgi:hypothetical protein